MTDAVDIGLRLAFREEGMNWNCYCAKPDTMQDAIFIGSIPMQFIMDPIRRAQFMALMRDCFSDTIEKLHGVRPVWPDPDGRPAPEAEKTKNA